MKTIKPQKSAVPSQSVGANLFARFLPQPAHAQPCVNLSHPQPVRMNSHLRNPSQPRANLSPPRLSTLVLALAAAFALPQHPAHAAPQGGQVVAGQATIAQPNANTTTITQSSQKAIIDWQSFSIAANQHTQFIQPSAASVTLNRVVGVDPSQILGRLTANGQVFLVNPNGIYFGKNAQIDVAGLIATTHNIRNADFLAGNYNFNIAGKAGAAVINDGMIHIADTGIAAFVAPSVANRGVIAARLGKIMLASANGFTLDFSGDQLISFLVNDQVAQTAFDLQGKPLTSFVENAGQIQAQGGYVLLTAKAAETAIHSVINQTGSIEATTVGTHNGTIILNAGTGSLNVAGTLDASAPNVGAQLVARNGVRDINIAPTSNGGFIETSGAHVKIDPNAKITTAAPFGKAGTWLIDPVDFIIAATGGDITGAQLAARLANSNIEIQTLPTGTGNGDIFVNDAVTWGSFNELILTAHRNVNVNALINATGGGSVRLRADSLGTGIGTVNFAGTGHINANNGAAVGIYYNPVSYTDALTKSDATGNPYSNNVTLGAGAAGMTAYMLVNDVNQLQAINTNLGGSYALGKNIDATATATWNAGAGFIPVGDGVAQFMGNFNGLGLTISNLTINRPTTDYVGLFGFAGTGSAIRNIGLIGGSTAGGTYVGGLAGRSDGTINYAYATGGVNGVDWVGGLVGGNYWAGNISNSYALGNVSENGGITGLVGGLVGGNWGAVNKSYASGNVIGVSNVGGLIGGSGGTISNSYASGSVTGIDGIGGLVGQDGGASIVNSYASGRVSGTIQVGGLVGRNPSLLVTNSYWDTQTSGQPSSSGGTGLIPADMKKQTSYLGWDFVNTWQIAPNGYPTLKAFTPQSTAQIITPTQPVTPPVVTPPTLTPAQALLVQQHQGDSTFALLLAISQGLFTNSSTDPVWVGMYQGGKATANQIAANTQRNIYDAYTAADIFAQIRAGTLVNNTSPTNNNWRVIYRNGQATAAQVAANAFDNTYTNYKIATAATLFNGLVTTKDISTSPTAPNAVVWNALVSNNTANANTAKRMWDTYNLYKNVDGATLLQGIYAKLFNNDPTDPIWRAMYVNGAPSPAQLQANMLWNIDQAMIAQAAANADQAKKQALADAAKAVDKAIADARAMTRPLSPDPRAVSSALELGENVIEPLKTATSDSIKKYLGEKADTIAKIRAQNITAKADAAARKVGLLNKVGYEGLTNAERRALQREYGKSARAWHSEASLVNTKVSELTVTALGLEAVFAVFQDAYAAYQLTSELEELNKNLPFLKDHIPASAWSEYVGSVASDFGVGAGSYVATQLISKFLSASVAKEVAASLAGGAVGVVVGVMTSPTSVGESSTRKMPSDAEDAVAWAKANSEFALQIENVCAGSATCIESSTDAGGQPGLGIWEFYTIKRDYFKALGADTSLYDWVDKYHPTADGFGLTRW